MGRAPSGGIKFKQWQAFYCLPPDLEAGDEPFKPSTKRLLRAMEAWAAKDLGQPAILGLHP